jgi:hypothetical protein
MQYTMPLHPNECTSAYMDLDYPYDSSHQVTVEAFSGKSKDSRLVIISAELPRVLIQPDRAATPDLLQTARLFVTPRDPLIIEASRSVFQQSSPPGYSGLKLSDLCPNMQAGGRCPEWMVLDAIEGWVAGHILLGEASMYAQLPRETLLSGKGDATDESILIVSLARAAGMRSDMIFVVLGANRTAGCGWVYDRVGGPYQWVSPDWHHPPWCQCDAYSPECCAMRAVYYFNDQVAQMAV